MNTLLPIFDPTTLNFLGYEKRGIVHKSGGWHMAIQANIVRQNKSGSLEILLQKRTNSVDIGKGKFDQSLAIQMTKLDKFNPENTLRRGLLKELGIKNYKSLKVKDRFYINKRYADQPGIWNREILKLFIVVLGPTEAITINKAKIASIEWISWRKFKTKIKGNRNIFTKTAQFYFLNSDIEKLMSKMSFCLLKGNLGLERTPELAIYHIDTTKTHKSLNLNKSDIIGNRDIFTKDE